MWHTMGCPFKATGVEPTNLVECTNDNLKKRLAGASLASSTLSSKQDLKSTSAYYLRVTEGPALLVALPFLT